MLALMSFNISTTFYNEPPSVNSPEANPNKALMKAASENLWIFFPTFYNDVLADLT